VAIDRTSKFTFVEVHEQATRPITAEFLRHLLNAVPYKIHTILTDNGIQFANRSGDKYAFQLLFDRICLQNSIDHRLTKPKHSCQSMHCHPDETHRQKDALIPARF